MLKRTLTGACLIAILLVGFLLRSIIDYRFLDLIVLAVALMASYEFNTALKDKTSKAQKILSITFSGLSVLMAVFFRASLFTFISAYVACSIIYCALSENSKQIDKIAHFVLSLIYPTIPLLFISLINQMGEISLYALVTMMVTTVMTDTFAYIVGSKLKGRKLCPNISPKKTVSGALGGLIGGIVSGVLVYYVFKLCGQNPFVVQNEISVILFIISSSALFSIVTQVGDLFESSLKRSLNVKDMGSLLPGHGGMLDRVDGLMFNAMAVYLCYVLLV